jgi:hypothetical protein
VRHPSPAFPALHRKAGAGRGMHTRRAHPEHPRTYSDGMTSPQFAPGPGGTITSPCLARSRFPRLILLHGIAKLGLLPRIAIMRKESHDTNHHHKLLCKSYLGAGEAMLYDIHRIDDSVRAMLTVHKESA